MEKALKAWLSAIGVEYPKVHDLKGLAQVLKKQHEAIPEELSSLLDLSDFAVQLRYDSYDAMGSGLDRENFIQKVSKLIDLVEDKIKN